jgi:hypothetical protein
MNKTTVTSIFDIVSKISNLNRTQRTIFLCSIVLFLGQLLSTETLLARGPASILVIKPDLFQTSLAKDVLARNVNSKIKLIDTVLEFTDNGLKCTATKEVTFFPDIPFSALIDVSCPKADFIELQIKEAKVIGVELKWLSAVIVNYLESKISEGKLNSYFSMVKKGWKRESKNSNYSILLRLKPENIIKALENPVIEDVSISSEGLVLTVDAEK